MTQELPLVIANWKMHKTAQEVDQFFDLLESASDEVRSKLWIAPSLIFLERCLQRGKKLSIKMGAQNISYEKSGPFTGEISAQQVSSCGAHFVIIGHSERRRLFQETELHIQRKIAFALEENLIPIVCIGETLQEKASGQTEQVLEKQLTAALSMFPQFNGIIAYEPVWAIGSKIAASLEEIAINHRFCRKVLENICSLGDKTPLLYGGSVTHETAKNLKAIKEVDGVLVGGASLEVFSLTAIIQGLLS